MVGLSDYIGIIYTLIRVYELKSVNTSLLPEGFQVNQETLIELYEI